MSEVSLKDLEKEQRRRADDAAAASDVATLKRITDAIRDDDETPVGTAVTIGPLLIELCLKMCDDTAAECSKRYISSKVLLQAPIQCVAYGVYSFLKNRKEPPEHVLICNKLRQLSYGCWEAIAATLCELKKRGISLDGAKSMKLTVCEDRHVRCEVDV